MFSTLTERGGAATLEALSLGADDYVAKASNAGSLDRSMASLRGELIPKIKQFFDASRRTRRKATDQSLSLKAFLLLAGKPKIFSPMFQPKVVAIGVSTGGPQALGSIIPEFPADFPLPILIVQHMPPIFTRLLADRLQTKTKLHAWKRPPKTAYRREGQDTYCPGRLPHAGCRIKQAE